MWFSNGKSPKYAVFERIDRVVIKLDARAIPIFIQVPETLEHRILLNKLNQFRIN